MIEYLKVHHHLTAQEIHQIEEIVSNTTAGDIQEGASSDLVSRLQGYGLAQAEAIFFRNWAFDQ
jgi:hypothetical protein